MGCNVCIGSSILDCDGSPEFYSVTNPKARKEYKCCECRRVIPKGTVYERSSGKFDGALYSDKTCLDCVDVRTVFSCGEVPPAPGCLWQEMRDYAFYDLTTASECFQKLNPSAKALCLAKWRTWKGLE